MAITRVRQGGVTATLDFDVAALVRRAVKAVSAGVVEALEEAGEAQVSETEAQWYSPAMGVTKRTGTSGRIEVSTTIDLGKAVAVVSVGSTDFAKAKYVHRPGPTSTAVVEIPEGEYRRVKSQEGEGRRSLVFHARKNVSKDGVVRGKFYRIVDNPNSSDGKYLIPTLIVKPFKARISGLSPKILASIDAKTRGGVG